MNRINNVISGYQLRIGKYDKQVWEQTIEQEVLKRLRSVPRKTAKVNTDLIDVDLFRGSAFSASKPNHGWVAITRMALLRAAFLPLYFRWWKSFTGVWLFGILCLLYVFQIVSLFIFIGSAEEERSLSSLSSAHAFCPCVMMFVLALIHTQMMSAAEFSSQYTRIRSSTRRDVCKKHSKASSCRPSTERERDSGGSHDTGIDLNAEDVGVIKSARHPPENVTGPFLKKRHESPGSVTYNFCKRKEDISEVVETISGGDLTSDVTSAFEKTSDWVRNLSPNECEVPVDDGFDPLSANPAPKSDLDLNDTGFSRLVINQSSLLLDLHATEVDEHCNKSQTVVEIKESKLESCDIKDIHEEQAKGSLSSLGHELYDGLSPCRDNGELYDGLSPCGDNGESGKVTETESVANSIASGSDAADSSLLSYPNDIHWGNDDDDDEVKYKVNPQAADDLVVQNVGLRMRKKSFSPDYRVPGEDLQANKVRTHIVKATSRTSGLQFSTARSAATTSKDFMPSEGLCKSFISSEEELDKAHGFSLRQIPSRKIALNQSTKFMEKQFCRISEISKPASQRVDSRSQPRVKIIDTRQMESTGISSCESDCEDRVCKGKSLPKPALSEWEDTVNTNTEMTSPTDTSSAGSSASDLSEKDLLGSGAETAAQGIQHASSVMNSLASNTDRVSCMIWEPNSVHKVDMTVMDIGWMIIQRVDKVNETLDYLILGFIFSLLLMFTPVIYRGYHSRDRLENLNYLEIDDVFAAAKIGFGQNWRQVVVIVNGMVQRLCLSLMFFFLLSVAERTFKQRLLYAKNFCYLTSSRRAKKYELPHFRLNKVRNIKTWLSLRCFLKKRGPQRTVDSIVSAAFLLSVILLSILCIELLQDYGSFLDHLSNWELVIWCMSIGIYLLRFITLGTKINKKYRNFSVLITEQINLYLHMEQKPHKKEELMVANSVLKLAEDLLKELESPFKISGLSANPFLYNITKVVVLSAFSAVLTELLGFKLKLYKIKIRS